MRKWFHILGLLACSLTLFVSLSGCRDKHREVQMREEQRIGPVEEDRPGEMQVE
ncbi:MAG: hypothetical protein AB1716_11840 [Planctomycetota bacterium]